jgi:hypothetical protein
LLKKNHRSVQADSEDVKIEGLTLLFSLIWTNYVHDL